MKNLLPVFAIISLVAISACTQLNAASEPTTASQTQQVYRYKLYPTENMWNFLKLDTRTGIIKIVQFSVEDGKQTFEYSLSNKDLSGGKDQKDGRFTLTPTQNRWTFIMLDGITGQTYQVQWSFEEEKRLVLPIF